MIRQTIQRILSKIAKVYYRSMKLLLKQLPFVIIIAIITISLIYIEFIVTNKLSDNAKEWYDYLFTYLGIIVPAFVPLLAVFYQMKQNHNQFAYTQKKNDISHIIDLSVQYLAIYDIDKLKQLLYDWQYNKRPRQEIKIELNKLKDCADKIWLQLSFEINSDNLYSLTFSSLQIKNYTILCDIFEDLRILFCYDYSDVKKNNSLEFRKISECRNRLSYCLSEKMLVKAVFEDYNLTYDKVKNQVFAYIKRLKADMSKTYKVYGKNENEKP